MVAGGSLEQNSLQVGSQNVSPLCHVLLFLPLVHLVRRALLPPPPRPSYDISPLSSSRVYKRIGSIVVPGLGPSTKRIKAWHVYHFTFAALVCIDKKTRAAATKTIGG